MESLKELNSIVQKPDYKTKGNWMARNITREASLPFTWLLLHTRVTANQITVASIIILLISSFLFSLGTITSFFIGALFFELWYLVDHIDGQIARYRKEESVTGLFLDFFSHHFPHLFIFPMLAIGYFKVLGGLHIIYAGILCGAMMTLINLINDSKYKAFFAAAEKTGHAKLKPDSNKLKKDGGRSFLKSIFVFMYKCCEVHVVMNVLFILSIFFITGIVEFTSAGCFILYLYTFLAGFLLLVKICHIVLTKKIDREFFEKFVK